MDPAGGKHPSRSPLRKSPPHPPLALHDDDGASPRLPSRCPEKSPSSAPPGHLLPTSWGEGKRSERAPDFPFSPVPRRDLCESRRLDRDMIQWCGQERGFAMSQTSFVELLIGNGIGRNERLEKIARLLDWSPVGALVEKVRPGDSGRPPYPPLAMFKALLLQQWYGLSDPGLEEALLDRVSFRRFCGLALDGATPDETTPFPFRHDLKAA